MQHQIKQQLHATLNALAGAEFPVAAAPHIQPAEHWPPQAGIHIGYATDRALAIVGDEHAVLFHKAGGEHTAGLIRAALELQAGFQEIAHDREASLHQQEQHHGNVVPQKHFVVVEGLILSPWMAEGGH